MGKWFGRKGKAAEAEAEKPDNTPDQQGPPPTYESAAAEASGPQPHIPHLLEFPGNCELKYPGYSLPTVTYGSNASYQLAVLGKVSTNLKVAFDRAVACLRLHVLSPTSVRTFSIGPHSLKLNFSGEARGLKHIEAKTIQPADACIVLFDTFSLESFAEAKGALSRVEEEKKGGKNVWPEPLQLPPVAAVGVRHILPSNPPELTPEQLRLFAAQYHCGLYLIDIDDQETGRLTADDMIENLVARVELARQERSDPLEPGKGAADPAAPPLYAMLRPQPSSGRAFNLLIGGDLFEYIKRSFSQTFRDETIATHQFDFVRNITVDQESWHVRLLGSYGSPLGRGAWRQYLHAADGFILFCPISNFAPTIAGFCQEILDVKGPQWKENGVPFDQKPIVLVGLSPGTSLGPVSQYEAIATSKSFGAAWFAMPGHSVRDRMPTLQLAAEALIKRAKLRRKQ